MSRINVIPLKKGWHEQERKPSDRIQYTSGRQLRAKYLSVKQVAERFGVGGSTVYELIYAGELQAEWFSGWRISEDALLEYLARSRQTRMRRRG